MHCLSSVYFICRPLHVSGVPNQPGRQSTKKNSSTNCCIYTVHLLMMGYKYARNIYIYIYIHTQTHTDCSTRRVKHKWQTLRPGRDKHCLARQTCLMQQISLHERLQSSEVQHDAKETAIRRVSWLLRRLASNHNKAGGRDVNDSHVPPGCIPLLDKIIVLRWSRRPR